jgi:ribosomal protein L37AE/L43A
MTIPDSPSAGGGARAPSCPFCHGKGVDTRATTITVTTYWRCLECDKTWTIPSHAPKTRRLDLESAV